MVTHRGIAHKVWSIIYNKFFWNLPMSKTDSSILKWHSNLDKEIFFFLPVECSICLIWRSIHRLVTNLQRMCCRFTLPTLYIFPKPELKLERTSRDLCSIIISGETVQTGSREIAINYITDSTSSQRIQMIPQTSEYLDKRVGLHHLQQTVRCSRGRASLSENLPI